MATVLHLHIPRTGGTGVRLRMFSAFRGERTHLYLAPVDFRAAAQSEGPYAAISGHFFWGLHADFPDGAVYFIVLRDPLERVGSLYDFIRTNPKHRLQSHFAERALTEIMTDPDVQNTQMSNGIVRQIAGTERINLPIRAQDLEQAWANLCRPEVVVTFTDCLDIGFAELSRRIGRPMPPHRDKLWNASPRTPLDPDRVDLIRNANEFDLELYRKARARFAR